MGHVLTIEGEEASAPAQEFAAMTGASVDAAVTSALKLLAEQGRERRDKHARLQDVLQIAAGIRTMPGQQRTPLDVDGLYDPATGLPA